MNIVDLAFDLQDETATVAVEVDGDRLKNDPTLWPFRDWDEQTVDVDKDGFDQIVFRKMWCFPPNNHLVFRITYQLLKDGQPVNIVDEKVAREAFLRFSQMGHALENRIYTKPITHCLDRMDEMRDQAKQDVMRNLRSYATGWFKSERGMPHQSAVEEANRLVKNVFIRVEYGHE